MAILGSVGCTALFREVLVFPIDQLPVLNRGKGVLLHGVRTVTDFRLWLGKGVKPAAWLSEEQPFRGLSPTARE